MSQETKKVIEKPYKIKKMDGSIFKDTRSKNIELNKNDLQKRTEVCESMPITITIADTIRCNLNCIMCHRNKNILERGIKPFLKRNSLTRKLVKFYSHHRRKTIMDFKLFKKIAKETFPYLNFLNLSVAGEPFVNPNFSRQLSIIEDYQVKLMIFTNATLLPKAELLNRLVNNLFMLVVSIDAARKKTYEDIRRGARFEQVINNIKRFNLARNQLNKNERPRLIFWFVSMRKNIEELPDYVHLAHSLEADAIGVCHIIVFNKKLEDESLIYHKELANHYLKQAKDLIDDFGMKTMDFPRLFNDVSSIDINEDYQGREILCRFLWSETLIELNGDVYPCCAPDRRGLWMGNIQNQTFKEIWNGEQYKSLRKSFKDGDLYPPCRNCYQRLKDIIADNNKIYFPYT